MASVLKPGVRSSLISGLALSGELIEPVGSGLSDRSGALKAARGELFLADHRTSRPADPTRSREAYCLDSATNGAAKMGITARLGARGAPPWRRRRASRD